MASAKAVAPFSGVSDSITLAVTRSIKPTYSPGDLLASLLANKNTSDDRKVYLLFPTPTSLCRAMLFPSSAVDATVLSGETLVGTIVRDDPSKASSKHTFTTESGLSGEALLMSDRATVITGPMDAGGVYREPKASRSIQSLINALVDFYAKEDLFDVSDVELDNISGAFAFVFDQTGDGTLKIYAGATAGTLTGKLADVEQVVESDASLDSLW